MSCTVSEPTQSNIRTTNSAITLANRWDHFLARWGVNRSGHRVEPGLSALGNPTANSPVFVTANYTLSFDALRSALVGVVGGYLASASAIAALLARVVLFPTILPWLPTRDFGTKGFILGGLVAVPFALAALLRKPEMECGACQRNCPPGAITVESGVGCAAAMIRAALMGRVEATCGCDAESSCCCADE